MLRRILRAVVGLSGIAGLLGLALLPPEHVHSIRSEDGHHSEVVHRHLESHFAEATTALHDADDHVEWIEPSFTAASPVFRLLAPPLAIGETLMPQLEAERGQVVQFVRLSAHDPPWLPPSGLRAPPSHLA